MEKERPTLGAFAGVNARNRQQAYNVLVDAVERSSLSQTRIAEDAGISAEHLSRMLQRPRNVEVDTLGKIVFAACGAALGMRLVYPASAARWTSTEATGSNSVSVGVTPAIVGSSA